MRYLALGFFLTAHEGRAFAPPSLFRSRHPGKLRSAAFRSHESSPINGDNINGASEGGIGSILTSNYNATKLDDTIADAIILEESFNVSSKASDAIVLASQASRPPSKTSSALAKAATTSSTTATSAETSPTPPATTAMAATTNTQPPLPPPPESDREVRSSWAEYDKVYTVFSAALVGILSGFAVALFKLSIEALRFALYGGSLSDRVFWWLIPALGGLGVAALAATGEFSPGLRGTASEIDACSLDTKRDGRFRNPLRFLRKPLGAIFTLGSGCSLGPEGPSVEVGMTMSRLCMPPSMQLSGASPRDAAKARIRRNRLLLSAGAAAGVSAGFNAPLSGVFFALEIVQQNFPDVALPPRLNPAGTSNAADNESNDRNQPQKIQQDYFSSGSESITAILIASVLSALVSQVYLAESLVLKVPTYDLKAPLVELPLYLMLGVVSGVVAGTFTGLAQFFKRFFDGHAGPSFVQRIMQRLPKWSKPVIGGGICGLVGLAFPQILFFGYDSLNSLLAKKLTTDVVLSLLAVKTFATAISASSGLVGGTFAPSLFLGGMTGALFHNVAAQIVTHTTGTFQLADVQAYALVGAAGVLSALFRAPLTASLLLFELTRDYEVILPLMATAGVGSVVGDAIEKAWEEKRRDRDAVSWGDLADEDDVVEDEQAKK